MQNYSQTARDDQGAIELLFGQCRILVDGSELITYSVQGETFVRHVDGRLHFVVNGGDYNADTPEELATILREEYENETIHPAAFSLANDAYFIASGVAAPSMTARSVSSSEGAGSSSGGAGAASGTSISAISNSRTRSRPCLGAISLRNARPICAAVRDS